MVAFAANSVLCRLALDGQLIDPYSFTSLRLLGGALILAPVSGLLTRGEGRTAGGNWPSGFALFAYAATFSLAYVYLDTGTGALALFGSVQATMISMGIRSGERPTAMQWLGLFIALGGLAYLVSPGITAPDPFGSLLMAIAGISWGVYSVRGRTESTPVLATGGNFARTVPMAAILFPLATSPLFAENAGIALAVISGSITSGLGYVLWYKTLPHLTATSAAIVQLMVPILAGIGGVLFLSEAVSPRLVVASILVLGGVAAAVAAEHGRTATD